MGEWYSPSDIRYRPEHIYFLIENLEELERGEWPPEESGYTDPLIKTQPSRAGFTMAVGFAAEVKIRLERCGKDGQLLYRDIKLGTTIPNLDEDSSNALWYCSGHKLKRLTYSTWLRQVRYRGRTMREGARYITTGIVKKTNLSYIVKRLEQCADNYDGCTGCPDIKECFDAYDERCGLGEVVCPRCGDSVPHTSFCSNCGQRLIRKRK